MSTPYIIGFIVGIALAVVLLFVLLRYMRKGQGKKCELDERQQIARGAAGTVGFFTFLVLNALYAMAAAAYEPITINTPLIMAIIIFVSVVAYSCVCIAKDAYVGLNEDPKRMIIVFIVIGIINLVIVCINAFIHHEALVVDGKISLWIINLLCGIMMFVIAGVYIYHEKHVRTEEEE